MCWYLTTLDGSYPVLVIKQTLGLISPCKRVLSRVTKSAASVRRCIRFEQWTCSLCDAIYGYGFTLFMDHKRLLYLFPDKIHRVNWQAACLVCACLFACSLATIFNFLSSKGHEWVPSPPAWQHPQLPAVPPLPRVCPVMTGYIYNIYVTFSCPIELYHSCP